MTTRRGFLAGLLTLGAAPAIVKADSLMKIAVPKHVAEGHFFTMHGYKFGNSPTDSIWTPTIEEVIANDRWETPPELEIRARPFISTDEISKAWSEALYREANKKGHWVEVDKSPILVSKPRTFSLLATNGRRYSQFPKGR